MSSPHSKFYAVCELYELAFSYRNFAKECDFLIDIYRRFAGGTPKSFLELAGGPAVHAREMARRGIRAVAVDISPEMVQYAGERALSEGVKLELINADMKSFKVTKPIDMAVCMLDSLVYLYTNEMLNMHLKTVAEALNPGGIYFIELEHPKYILGTEERLPKWTMSNEKGTVAVQWGEVGESYDPITRCKEVTAILEFTSTAGEKQSIRQKSIVRGFLTTDIEGLVSSSGCFRLVKLLGDFKQDFSMEDPKAWRMLCVLQKK